ncbi:MAG TPA: MG2 domain-containing protein [Kofleriaceae bacterium]
MRHVAVIALAAVVACGGKKQAEQADQPGTVKAQDVAKGSGDAPPRRAAITPKLLSPVVIHEVGADGTVPTAVMISVASPIIDGAGSPSTAAFKITPAIPGTMMHTGITELTFTPERPFDFDTTYQLELTALDTLDGPIGPAAGEKWSYSFKTPAFKFLGWSPTDIDLTKHTITMDIAFSGAVLPNIAGAAMSFAVDGKPPAGVAMQPSGAPGHIVVTLSDPHLVLGAKLSLAIKATVAALTGVRGSAASAEYLVSNDKVVSIKTAAIVEGASGFYLEVVCDDSASRRGNRAYYEGQGYYNLSVRCQLTDDSLKHVHLEPAVKKMYIASGRAGFRVFGDFKRGVYKVTIDGGATSVDGGVVLAPFSQSFSVAARRPQLTFAASGRYLPRTAWTNLGIKHTNIDSANLVIRQIPAENLVFWLGEGSDAATERTSDVILKKTVPLRGDPDAPTTSWLDVRQLLPATTKGVLELKLVGVGAQATSRLLLTNMSLVAKKWIAPGAPGKPGLQTVQVWALDMDSAEPLNDVEVSLVRQSGKAVDRCTTKGGDGCTLAVKADDPDDAVPFAVIARKGDDLTYIRYQDLRADVAESSTSGAPFVPDTPYRAAIYSDRGVYRPGDTAHVVAIVRDVKDRAPEQPLPVDVQVVDPRTKVVRKLALKTNAAGVIALDQVFPAFADTGHWRVSMTVADKPLTSHDLQVEEFVPERLRATITPKKPQLVASDKAVFDVSAQYLFGGSAIDSGVELTCAIEPDRFAPDDNGDLTYGVLPKGKPVPLGESRDQLDPKGHVAIACPDPEAGTGFTGTAKLTATAAVLEAGSGRATVRTATAILHPEKYYVGLRAKVLSASPGEAFTVEGLVVDWAGKIAPQATGQVHVELAHLEADYGYGRDDASGDSRYDRWLRVVPEGKQDVKVVDGKLRFDVTPAETDYGFLIRVSSGKARTELVIPGGYAYQYYEYEYGDGGRIDQTPRPAKPTQLAVKLPKEIKAGEAVTASVRSPYRGKVLWTVETDRLITAAWKDVTPGEATWSFTLDKFAPNVYVSAFVVKDPHLESRDAFLPDRAFGVGSAHVVPVEMTQAVQLTAPKEIRSSSPLAVTLDVGKTDGPAFATVAVVDEGILSLTSFQSPNPLGQLFAKRALGVETYETIGWTMLHQPAGASSKTGGGDDAMEAAEEGGALGKGRVQPVKPVALFSGVVPVGADGKVTIPFQVPQYRGELRVMAVVSTAVRIGRAEAKVMVRDPLVIQVTFPRFVIQNDELQIPVFLTNLSGGPLDVTVTLNSEALPIAGLVMPRTAVSPLSFTGKDTGSVKLANGFPETLVFQAKAVMAVGGAKLRVVARARGPAGTFEVKDEVDVPFLPAGPKERAVQKIRLDAGPLDLTARATALKNWAPLSETSTFWVTNNPYGEVFDHLSYLVHYPYGCIEQTTSSTRPLLYVASLVEQVDPKLAELKIEDMVLAGIARVFSMETPSGGFGYWPGATEPLEWATAYATDMLLDAKQQGYAVPEDRLKEVLRWIEGRLAQYERGQKIVHEPWNHYDEQSEAYLHYVLARAGKGKKARILNLISRMPAVAKSEQAEDLYMLKAALFRAGDRRYEKELKAVDTTPIVDERINSWSFYSDRRRRGMMLSTFVDLFGNDPAGEPLATRVAEGLSDQRSYWYNTQELVWGVSGLGKWVAGYGAKGTPGGTLVADGQTIKPRAPRRKTVDKAWALIRASEYKQLTLDVPAQAAGTWLVISSEGVRPGTDYKVGGNGLSVSRTYRDLSGAPIDLATGKVKLGDLMFVELQVANTSTVWTQNVALVDRLPAGFEVENPRLGRATKPDWIKDEDQWTPEFMNLRDDRLEAFGALPGSYTRKIIYTVRAVTSGKFTVPPAEVEAMYDPTLWARDRGGTVVVGGPWTGKTL